MPNSERWGDSPTKKTRTSLVGSPRLMKPIKSVWCERGGSNPHSLSRQILSLVRLPVPPLSHILPVDGRNFLRERPA